MTTIPTVYIVDDDPAARKSVAALIKTMDVTVITYASAEDFLANYDEQQMGCLVTDVRMLGMSGIDLQEKLARQKSPLPIIIITAYADVPLAVRVMEGGAVTLLEKPCRDQELWEAIRSALERGKGNFQLSAEQREVELQLGELSPQEHVVLELIVAGKANKVIARELEVSLRTVETRRQQIFKKMRADSVAELVRTVVEFRKHKK